MEIMQSASQPHAVMFPFAAIGHFRPLMQLARRLAHVYGFRVTVVTTSYIYNKMGLATSGGDNLHFVDLQEGFPDSYYTITTMKNLIQELSTLGPLLKQLLQRLRTEPHPITCVISDVVFDEAHRAAVHHAIPSIAFSAQCIMAVVAKYYGRRLVEKGLIPFPKEDTEAAFAKMVTGVPGMHPMKLQDYYSGFWINDLADPFFQFLIGEHSTSLHQREWILSNSIFELEREVVEAFQQDAGLKLATVGPLAITPDVGNGSVDDDNRNSTFWPEETSCMDWLSEQKPTSVIYVSFGSLAMVPARVMEELLLGLEESRVPFLVVLRPGGVEGNVVEEIRERTKDRGLFVSWAPQLKVLRHSAIAGFLTHCGWNSFLESVSMGVPLLCHPFFLDQPMINRYIVSVWKIGLEFDKRADGSLDRADVVKKVKALAAKESVIRTNVKAWSAVATRAVGKGGSSQKNLAAFAEDMYRRVGGVN